MVEKEFRSLEGDALLMSSSELDNIAGSYDPSSPEKDFDYWFIRLNMESMESHLIGRSVCELGCSTGLSTRLLSSLAKELTVVEGSRDNIARAETQALKNVRFVHSFWESFETRPSFSDVVAMRVLEHIEDPVSLLQKIKQWLLPGGRIHLVVPNARSLHRRVGLQMGLLNDLHELNARDRRVGHKRVYDREILFDHLRQAGCRVRHWEGIFLKPLSNDQLKSWPENLVRAFSAVGKELPDWSAELYVCVESDSDIPQ
jgi:trans-aconitate methyltransferase